MDIRERMGSRRAVLRRAAALAAGGAAALAGRAPGAYLMACFFPDPSKGGEPHAAEGMAQLLTVA